MKFYKQIVILLLLTLMSGMAAAKSSSSPSSSGRASSFGSSSSSSSSSSLFSSSKPSTPSVSTAVKVGVGTGLGVAAVSASADTAKPSGSDTGRASAFGSSKPVQNTSTPPIATNTPKPLFAPGTTSAQVSPKVVTPPVAQDKVASYKARNTPPVPVQTINTTRTNVRYTYVNRTYYTPPAYTSYYVGVHPNYGLFDAVLLWSLLDHNSDRNFYYNHRSEPSFQQWKMDAQALCNQGNTQVCEQLADLDKDAAQRVAQNQPVNPNYAPAGVGEVDETPDTIPTEQPSNHAFLWIVLGSISIASIVIFGLVAYGRRA
jgi:hypothetical protein